MIWEVAREFCHAVTGDDMLLVDFGGVIGKQAVVKKHCTVRSADGARPSEPTELADMQATELLSPTRFGGTHQEFLPQFEAPEGDQAGLSQFLVVGDLELPPLSPDPEPPLSSYSSTIGVTYPSYLLPIL